MERRNAEKQSHLFEEEFVKTCNLFDLQGLLLGENNKFTAAVEAFTYTDSDHLKTLSVVFSDDEWNAKISFAESLNIKLYIFLHKIGTTRITCYPIDSKSYCNKTVKSYSMTENEFLQWWKEHKKTIQNKAYRGQLQDVINKSYFDGLLEKHDLKWGGNIDGFILTSGNNQIPRAIIENRFTEYEPIKTYDPFKYYDKDIMTWKPLIILSQTLNIPCFLCTYSKRTNEERIIGISELAIDYSIPEPRFVHKNDIKPSMNLFTDLNEAKLWLFDRI